MGSRIPCLYVVKVTLVVPRVTSNGSGYGIETPDPPLRGKKHPALVARPVVYSSHANIRNQPSLSPAPRAGGSRDPCISQISASHYVAMSAEKNHTKDISP